MKNLFLIAALLFLAACSKTGVQIKNESETKLYSVVIYYYDESDNLLNSYPVADSLDIGSMSKIIDVENKSNYAKIIVDVVPKHMIEEALENKRNLEKQYKDSPYLPYIISETDNVISSVKGKVFCNKYYINDKKITNIIINKTNRIE